MSRLLSVVGVPWGRPEKSRFPLLFLFLDPAGTPFFGGAHADRATETSKRGVPKKNRKTLIVRVRCDPEGGPITPTFGDYSPLLRGHQRRVSYIFSIAGCFLRSRCGVSAIAELFLCHPHHYSGRRRAEWMEGGRRGGGKGWEGAGRR